MDVTRRKNDIDHSAHRPDTGASGVVLAACGFALAAILILPALGVSTAVSAAVAVAGMIAVPAGVMARHVMGSSVSREKLVEPALFEAGRESA